MTTLNRPAAADDTVAERPRGGHAPPPSSLMPDHPGVTLVDPEDPQLHPALSDEQLQAVARFSVCRKFAPDDPMFEHGQRDAPFIVIRKGCADVYDLTHDGTRQRIAHVAAGRFIGDLSMFTGEPTVAGCVAGQPTEAMVMDRHQLRQLIAEHSDVGDVILRTFIARREWLKGNELGFVKVLGSRWSRESYRLRDFLSRNHVMFHYYDVEADAESRVLLDKFGLPADDVPIMICPKGVCRNPSIYEVANHLGLSPEIGDGVVDVAVVGGGPGGLAAAVYAASEGLSVAVIEADSPGGQAVTSSKIENYLGFPTGLSGEDLAQRALLQARKFGATITSPRTVQQVDCRGGHKSLTLCSGEVIHARSVVIAVGAAYRKLDCPRCEDFDGKGVYYGAAHTEAQQCRGEEVVVVGGGNSAGQAAIHLAKHADRVRVLIRRGSLAKTMSRYLIDRIEKTDNIELCPRSEITDFRGGATLESITITDKDTDDAYDLDTCHVFVMIGADPRTDWLAGCCGLDDKGFVVTGELAKRHAEFAEHWAEAGREPMFLETTRPGVFAVGDVRAGSIKRVASAVGEGSMAVKLLHEHLAAV